MLLCGLQSFWLPFKKNNFGKMSHILIYRSLPSTCEASNKLKKELFVFCDD